MSTNVATTPVTGMPTRRTKSVSRSVRRYTRTPSCRRSVGAVTSISRTGATTPQSAAAVVWLTTPSQASVAPIHSPRWLTRARPTA